MSSEPLRRQDASSHMPVAVCHNGQVIDLVPQGVDDSDQPTREALFAAASAETGIPVMQLEILLVCHLYPTSSAVDCLDCEPA